MLLIIYIAVFLLLLIPIKKNNIEKDYTWILIATILSLLIITTENYADLDNYTRMFNSVNKYKLMQNSSLSEMPGWVILCYFLSSLGINFRGMSILIIFIACYLIHRSIALYIKDERIFWAFFMLFPATIECVQLRLFLAMSIIIYAFISSSLTVHHAVIKYIVGIVIACIFHTACLIFLLFVPIFILKEKSPPKAVAFSICTCIIVLLGFPRLMNVIEKVIPNGKFQRYFLNTITPTTFEWLIVIFLSWISCTCLYYVVSKLLDSLSKDVELRNLKISDKEFKNLKINMFFSITLMSVTLLFLYFDKNFHRFLEVGFIFLNMTYSLYVCTNKIKRYRTSFFYGYTIILLIIMRFYTPYQTVLKPFFTYSGFSSCFK